MALLNINDILLCIRYIKDKDFSIQTAGYKYISYKCVLNSK